MDDFCQQRLRQLHLPAGGQNFLVRLHLTDDIGFVVECDDAEQVALPGVGKAVRFKDTFKHLIPWKFIYVEAGDSLDRVVDDDVDSNGTRQGPQQHRDVRLVYFQGDRLVGQRFLD